MTTITAPWMALHSPQGTTGIKVRPIQYGDANLLYEMHQRLSPESVYYRYLQYRRPTLAELTVVCNLAAERGTGFVATTRHEPTTLVGMAYYVREQYALEPTAEPGILVEDRFQAQGIGRRLWQQVQYRALVAGIHWLRVWSHPDNQRMAQLVRGGGFPYTTKVYDGLSEHLVALSKQPAHLVRAQSGKERHSPLRATLG